MTTNDAPTPARGTRRWAVLAVVVAVSALAFGAWLMWRSTHPTTFGWFAYAPLSDTVYSPPRSSADVVGLALVVVGTLGLGGVAGYALGRRHSRR